MGSTARPSQPPERFARERLVPLLAPTLGGWTRTSLRSVRLPSDGPAAPPVEAEYTAAAGRAVVTVTLVRPGAAWTGAPVERAFDGGTEKLYRLGQRPVREAHHDSPARTVVTISLANGIVLTASSPVADAATLRSLLEAVDLDAAERLRPDAR